MSDIVYELERELRHLKKKLRKSKRKARHLKRERQEMLTERHNVLKVPRASLVEAAKSAENRREVSVPLSPIFSPCKIQLVKAAWPSTTVGPRTGPRHNLRLSHVMLAAHGSYPTGFFDEASHLCHSSKCTNHEHLVWEHKSRNNKRRRCSEVGYCVCFQTPHCFPHTKQPENSFE